MRSFIKAFTIDQHMTASSLSGFIAGTVSASIIWFSVVWVVKLFNPGF